MNTPELDRLALPLVPTARDAAPEDTRTRTVLFVDQAGELGGAEFALLPLAAACASRGEVVLLAEGPFRNRLEAAGVRVQTLCNERVSGIDREAMRLGWIRALPAILAQIRSIAQVARRHDVLFLNTQKALVLGALGARLHRRPVVWYLHDIVSADHFGRVQRMLVKWIARHAVDSIIANSRASADALVALTGLRAEDITIVHNGIDTSAFAQADAGDIGALRERLGLPRDAWLAGLFGRLAPWKGQHIAIEALPRLPEVHLVLVGAALFGEDAYEARLRQLAQRLGVANRVHFANFQHDMPAWMQAMDVILHTSTEPEPFGRVIVEGMAAGRPVVASAAGGVVEIIRHLENGWLVKPGDPAALVEAVRVIRAAPEFGQRLAERARDDAQRHFSLDRYVTQMTNAIAAVRR